MHAQTNKYKQNFDGITPHLTNCNLHIAASFPPVGVQRYEEVPASAHRSSALEKKRLSGANTCPRGRIGSPGLLVLNQHQCRPQPMQNLYTAYNVSDQFSTSCIIISPLSL